MSPRPTPTRAAAPTAPTFAGWQPFRWFARYIRKNLAGYRAQSAAADEPDRIGGFNFFAFRLEHPTFVEADAFDNGADKLAFAGFQADVEEHSLCVRIFKRASVAVQPRSENHAVATCRHVFYDGGHIVVEAGVFRL